MRYAIVESGGKQYRVIEGELLDVDRLPLPVGKAVQLERILLFTDGEDVRIGTPSVGGATVRVTVVDHIRGKKVTHFRYSPKKRIRVRGGHRQDYTRVRVDFVGIEGEARRTDEPVARPTLAEATAAGTADEIPVVDTKPAKKSAPAKKAAAKVAKKVAKGK